MSSIKLTNQPDHNCCTGEHGSKYGKSGLFSAQTFQHWDIPDNIKPLLAELSNHSLAQSTWSSYKTGINKLNQFSEETGTNINLPLKDETVISYVGWLLKKGVASSTVNTYLSGLRQLHLTAGLPPPTLKSPMVNIVLSGKKNIEDTKKRAGGEYRRLPITLNMLKYIKLTKKIKIPVLFLILFVRGRKHV